MGRRREYNYWSDFFFIFIFNKQEVMGLIAHVQRTPGELGTQVIPS